MKISVFNRIIIIILLLFKAYINPAAAQQTNAKLTISNKSFPERKDFTESVRISSISYSINGSYMGSLAGELGDPASSYLNGEIKCTSTKLVLKINVTYIHHTWNVIDRSYTMFKTDSINLTLDVNGSTPVITFKITDLVMVVDWSFSVRIDISPFKPLIDYTNRQCYKASNLQLTIDNCNFNFSNVKYEWQYGFYTEAWVSNPEFDPFINRICNTLSLACNDYGGTISCEMVNSAVRVTDYSSLRDDYDLYSDIARNRYVIASHMLNLILAQNYSILPAAERDFLTSNFYIAIFQEPVFEPPDLLTNVIKEWKQLGISNDVKGLLNFDPSSGIIDPSISSMTRITFRVRAFNDTRTGPFSNIHNVDVKPPAPTFIVKATPSCPNRESAVISLTSVSGNIPGISYRYLVRDGEAEDYNSFSGTSYQITKIYGPGNYTVSVDYDDDLLGGCPNPNTINIQALSDLTFSISHNDAKCNHSNDGSIEAKILTRNGDYQFKLGASVINNQTAYFNKLYAGVYTIEIKDACYIEPKTWGVTIKEPPAVAITSVTKTDPTCLATPNGSFTVSAVGGSGTFDYQVLNSVSSVVTAASGQGSSWTSGKLPGGSYTIQARSGACPWQSSPQSLVQVQPVNFSVNVKNVDCYGQSTGSITVNASGGQSPYKYSINNQTFISQNSFASLSANTYQISVHTNDMICNDVKTSTVTVTSAPRMEIGITPVNATCFEKNDGKITASVTGGTAPFSYSWEEYSNAGWFPTTGSTASIVNLFAGTYRINVRDSKNCPGSKTTVLTEPAELTVESVTSADAVCFGEKGSIELKAAGGVGGYTYICYNDAGNVYQNSATKISVPRGDYHFKVRDKNGCEADNPDEYVTVTGPDAPLAFITVLKDYNGFNVPCSGDKTGEVRIEASGGNGYGYTGYFYSLSGSAATLVNTFGSLSAGSYSVKVSDGRGCSVQKTLQLIEPQPVNLLLMHSEPVRCFGESTGEILVSASGGVENTYVYRINDSDNASDVFSNLSAGLYDIEVADLNGCRSSISAEIQSLYPPIVATLVPSDVKCNGENSGEIAAEVSGGSGSYNYEWQSEEDGIWQPVTGSDNVISGLFRGEYRLKVTDSENCSLYKDAMVNEPVPLLIGNVISKDAVCYGEKGNITVESEGGVGIHEYFFTGGDGINFPSDNPGYDLPAGLYDISVRDENACEKYFPEKVEITSPEGPLGFNAVSSSYNGYSVSCSGKDDGSVEIQAFGGNGSGYSGYYYSIEGSSSQAVNIFDGLRAGYYNIMVTDGRGCIFQDTVMLSEPDPLNLDLLYSEPVRCYGEATGKIAVTASGGIDNSYTYRLNGVEILSPGLFTNLYARAYQVEVSDANGCINNLYASVENKNAPLEAGLFAVSANCYGESTGSIQSDVTGGAGGFVYKWEKQAEADWQEYSENSGNPGNLAAGYYRLTVEDDDNCLASAIIRVTEPDPVEITEIIKKDAICYDDRGSIDIKASGGTPGYKFFYSIDNSGFTEYLSGSSLSPGSYKMKVTDSKGCAFLNPEEVAITRPIAPLDFEWDLKDYNGYNVSCHGKNDGEIIVYASGGNGESYSGYLFGLENTALSTENVFEDIEAGNYEMKVLDGRGCYVSKIITLKEPVSDIFLTASHITMPVCKYDSNGLVALEAHGGTGPYLYNVNGREYTPSDEFRDLANGAYIFRVKDVNGCGETFRTTLENSVSEMRVSGVISDSRCYGQNSGFIDVAVTGGARPYGFTWENSPSLTAHAGNLYKGSYAVSVMDSAGCKAEQVFYVGEPDAPLSLSALTDAACVSQENGSVAATAIGGTPPYRYAIDELKNMRSAGYFDVYAGKHEVFVLDTNNCQARITVDVKEKNSMPDINFMLATSRYEADTLVIIDVSVPAPDRVMWQFSSEVVLVDSSSYAAKIKYDHSGVYPVKMTGVFGDCSYTIDKLLEIAPFDPLVSGTGDHYRGIKSITISPNPNDSHFDLKIELYTKQQVNIKVFDYYSRLIFNDILPPDLLFTREISLGDVLPGTYVLWVIAEDDARPAMLIISQ